LAERRIRDLTSLAIPTTSRSNTSPSRRSMMLPFDHRSRSSRSCGCSTSSASATRSAVPAEMFGLIKEKTRQLLAWSLSLPLAGRAEAICTVSIS